MEPEIDRSIEGKVWFDMLLISIDEFECANQSTRRMGRPVGRRLREQLSGWPGMDGTRMVCWPQITTPPNHQSFPFQFDRSDHPFYAFDRSTEQPPNPKANADPPPAKPKFKRRLGHLPSSPFAISSPSASLACTHPSALYVTRAERALFDRQDQQHMKSLGRAPLCTYRCDARGALSSSIPFLVPGGLLLSFPSLTPCTAYFQTLPALGNKDYAPVEPAGAPAPQNSD